MATPESVVAADWRDGSHLAASGAVLDTWVRVELRSEVHSYFKKAMVPAGQELEIAISQRFLCAGQSVTFRRGSGAYSGLWILALEETARPCTILLHDPRPSCANVFVPGLPYGRPLSFTVQQWLLLLFPSFIEFSITPPGASIAFAELQIGIPHQGASAEGIDCSLSVTFSRQ